MLLYLNLSHISGSLLLIHEHKTDDAGLGHALLLGYITHSNYFIQYENDGQTHRSSDTNICLGSELTHRVDSECDQVGRRL